MGLSRCVRMVCVVGAFVAVGAPAAEGATPVFTPVAGSPFMGSSGIPDAVGFSPSGRLLAVADQTTAKVDMISVSPQGVLSEVGSTPTGEGPWSLAFSPSGNLLAVANSTFPHQFAGVGSVSMFSVSATGALTPVPGSPFPAGNFPQSVAFSSDGSLVAVANWDDKTVSIFSVSASGVLTPVVGSPFAVSGGAASVAFSPQGGFNPGLLAVGGNGVSMFSVSAAGALAPISGSPFASGVSGGPVAFSADGSLLASGGGPFFGSGGGYEVAVFSVMGTEGLSLAWAFPAGQVESVAFSPGDLLAAADYAGLSGPNEPGTPGKVHLLSFSASNGEVGGLAPVPGSPLLTGLHPDAVAFSPNGVLLASANYGTGTVSMFSSPPQAAISAPAAGQTYTLGQSVATSFSCADSPYGSGISACADSNGASGAGGRLETSTLGPHTYTVSATSSDGLTGQASIAYSVVPVPSSRPPIVGCAAATGRITGTRLGPVKLGMTRAAVPTALGESPAQTSKHSDAFCVTPTGIRVGYAGGRAIWISTTNRHYAIKGIRVGSSVTVARRRLVRANRFHVGSSYWYLAPVGPATGIVEVRRGAVIAIGIAAKKVIGSRRAERALVRSMA